MKNHKRVNGKLLQTNKTYSHLKRSQQEKIYQWMYESYRAQYDALGRFPGGKDEAAVLSPVIEKIEQAEIWIPYGEIAKHYHSKITALRKRLDKEIAGRAIEQKE